MSFSKIFKRHRVVVIAALLLAILPGVSLAQSREGATIYLQYAEFDPLKGEPTIAAAQLQSVPLQGEATYLLQFIGPVQEEWKDAVQQAGVRLYDYVPDFAFIARMDGEARTQVSRLPFVRWVGLYHPAYRLAPSLQSEQLASAETTTVELMVEALPEVNMDELAQRARELGGTVRGQAANAFGIYLHLILPADRLALLTALDGVLWVEPYFQPVLHNDVGGSTIMRASEIRASLGLYGSGQVVGVSDSGLDVGTTGSSMSNDFEGRIVDGRSVCPSGSGYRTTWNDPVGHGTHVSGSVLGSGAYSDGRFAGVAPQAKIVFQSVDGDGDPETGLECVPDDLVNDLFALAYSKGARIHTNSWGGPSGGSSNPYGGYTTYSRQVDQAAWQYKDLLILFSAGNEGVDKNRDGLVDLDSLGSPGTAKNSITVGATENNRPSITTTYGSAWSSDFPSNPIHNDRIANNAGGMAAFSSRGPTDDGRIKPDVVAPGTFIISARSHDPGFDPSVGSWGVYDSNYVYMGGTSMSAPLTAGATALLREWLVRVKGIANPSAALIKALLINGAEDISPGQYTSPQEVPNYRPNPVSGWGRVNLVESISPAAPRRVWFKENTIGIGTGSVVTYTLTIGSGGMQWSAEGDLPWTDEASLQPETSPAQEATPTPPQRRPVVLRLDHAAGAPESSPQQAQAAVSLKLDDGSSESSWGVGDYWLEYAYQFIWLNRFTPAASDFPFRLTQIQVLFSDGWNNVNAGDPIDLVVYTDADGDPSNGATLRATYHATIQTVDGTTWSTYTLSPALNLSGPGDVLIGVIPRYIVDGESLMSYPALLDEDSSQQRSWWGWWSDTPPDPATLPPDDYFALIDVDQAGNWLIRGYGETGTAPTPTATRRPPTPTPTRTPTVTPRTTGTPLVRGGPFRLTLAWMDYPASLSASRTLVNNLDLEVIAPDGTHYYGNGGVYAGGSPCLRAGKWDQCNNVEGVIIPTAYYGTYTVIVHAYSVPNGPQPFALVASGDYLVEGSPARPTPTVTPRTPTATPAPVYLPLIIK